MTRLKALLAALTIACSGSLYAHEPPRMVVVISIDQFPYEFLERFRPYFSEHGLGRLLQNGANFTNAYYPYSTTFTGPGHASIGTGRTPAQSGIVANTWFDRLAGVEEYCVEDQRALPSDGKSDPVSPINLTEDALGDRVKERDAESKIVGISIKDRSAILMAGRKADAAYWFDPALPGFVSSSYYRFSDDALRFNARVPAFVAAHPEWTMSDFIPATDLKKVTYDAPEVHKFKNAKFGVTFPHPIKDANAILYTPFGNDLVLDFARHLIDVERFGRDESPDILFIGLSSPDYLGHYYGPESLEVADTVVRTDRQIGSFIADLEKKIGTDFVVVLTADHGIQSIPEIARMMGRRAGRVNFSAPTAAKTIGEFEPQRRDLELAIAKRLKIRLTPQSPAADKLIAFYEEPALYLNWDRVRALKLDPEQVKRVLRDELLKFEGVAAAFTNSELLSANAKPSALERTVRLTFRPDRSGDVVMALKEGYIFSYAPTGTNHGQPVERDQHVPLIFWGAGVKAGNYSDRVSPLDIASTLGPMLGVSAGTEGAKPLSCCAN